MHNQDDLARQLGVKQQTVSRWEAGTSRPGLEQTAQLAAILGIDPVSLSIEAGYAHEVATVSFDRPLPLAALSPDSFEQFSLDLLATLYRDQAEVHQAGKTGHKQHGIDIEVSLFAGDTYTFQCKREAQFGAAKVRKAIKAQTFPAKKKYILLSRVASPEARKAIRSAQGWQIWDRVDISRIFRTLPKAEQVRIVDIFFPSQRFALTGETEAGPWLTVGAFFAPHLVDGRIFNQRWELVGRAEELGLLATALADPAVVAVSLIGRAGEGKSRVLLAALESFSLGRPHVLVRVASQPEDIAAKHLEDLGPGEKLIVVDDAHDRNDLAQIVRYAADERNHARLLLVYRPYWTDVVERELARFGITDGLAVPVRLSKPTKQDATRLAAQVLSKYGAPTQAASAIAALAYDSPLAVVVGAQIVAKEKVHPELFGSNETFRSTVLKHYEKMIAQDIAIGKDQERIHEILQVLALIQPVVPDDRNALELLSSVADIEPQHASRLARVLIESGVLFRRGGKYRLSPDLLADAIIETSCITSDGESNGYAERIFAAACPEHKEHVLINLGRLDWRRNEGDTSASRLLDGVWSQLRWEDGYEKSEVKAAASAARYQPRQALAFARQLINQGHGRDEDVCRMIRNAAYTLRFVPDACALLWEAGHNDVRTTNSHPSHPIRLLAELATPEPRKPAEFVLQVVEFALSLMEEPDSWREEYTPFDVIRGALVTSGQFTSAASSRAFTITQYAVRLDEVKVIRELIVAELFRSLESSKLRRAFLAAQTLGDALRGPIGARGGDDDDWGPEFVKTLSQLDTHLDDVPILAPVLVRVAESVHWHAFYGPDQTRTIALRILDKLDRDIETRVCRALLDAWGTNTWPIEREAGRPRHEAVVSALCDELNYRFGDAAELAQFLNARLEDIRSATGSPDYGLGQLFVGRLLVSNLRLACYVVERRLDGDSSAMASHAGRALGALLSASRAEGSRLVMQLLEEGDLHLQVVAEGYVYATHPPAYSETDVAALRRVFCAESEAVLRFAAGIAHKVAQRDSHLAIDLLSGGNIDLALRSTRDYFIWLANEDTIPFDAIRDEHLHRLLDGLRGVPRLDDHWVNAFLKKAIGRDPEAVLKLAKARIEASIASEDWSMSPLGSVFDNGDALELLALPDGVPLLRNLLEWALEHIDNYQFSYRFAELVRSLCSPYCKVFASTIEDWLITGATQSHCAVITAVVREAGQSFVFDHEGFVARVLRAARSIGRTAHKDLSSALFASSVSGVRSGIRGQPFEADLQLQALAVERLRRITRADAEYDLYSTMRAHAAENIERQIAEGRRMDEEDEDS